MLFKLYIHYSTSVCSCQVFFLINCKLLYVAAVQAVAENVLLAASMYAEAACKLLVAAVLHCV